MRRKKKVDDFLVHNNKGEEFVLKEDLFIPVLGFLHEKEVTCLRLFLFL